MLTKVELEDYVRIKYGVDVYATAGRKLSAKQIETARVIDVLYIKHSKRMTKAEAVRLSLLGVPLFSIVLKLFLRKLAIDLWEKLNQQWEAA